MYITSSIHVIFYTAKVLIINTKAIIYLKILAFDHLQFSLGKGNTITDFHSQECDQL